MVAPHRAHGRLRLVGGHLTGGDRAAAAATSTAAVAAEIPAGLAIDLAGRVALVTGATGQLGRTMVRTLARAGADMAVHYRGNRAKAESLCEEVRQMGGRAVAVFAEVDSEESVNAMRDAIVDALGTSPGIVVANAVEQYTWTSVLEQGVDDYESQYRTCVLQNVLLAKAFCPQMIEQRWYVHILNRSGFSQLLTTATSYSPCHTAQHSSAAHTYHTEGIIQLIAE